MFKLCGKIIWKNNNVNKKEKKNCEMCFLLMNHKKENRKK